MESIKVNVKGTQVAIRSPHGMIAFDHKTTTCQVHHDHLWGVVIEVSGGMKLTIVGKYDFPDSLEKEARQQIIRSDFHRFSEIMFDIVSDSTVQGDVYTRNYPNNQK